MLLETQSIFMSPVFSGLAAGIIGAIGTYILTRKKSEAEINKIKAETQNINLQNESLRNHAKTLNEENATIKQENVNLNKEITEIKLISTGMVVAYFYSFIEPLFEKISSMELTISEGDKNYPIKNESTKLELIIPKQLDKISFDSATKYNTSFNVGEIKTIEGKILYKQITYRIDKNLNEAVILIDAPAILKSALRYYKVPMFESKKNLEERLLNEMTNFKSQVYQMIENGDLTDKVTIIER